MSLPGGLPGPPSMSSQSFQEPPRRLAMASPFARGGREGPLPDVALNIEEPPVVGTFAGDSVRMPAELAGTKGTPRRLCRPNSDAPRLPRGQRIPRLLVSGQSRTGELAIDHGVIGRDVDDGLLLVGLKPGERHVRAALSTSASVRYLVVFTNAANCSTVVSVCAMRKGRSGMRTNSGALAAATAPSNKASAGKTASHTRTAERISSRKPDTCVS